MGTLFIIRFVLGGPEDNWICDKKTGEWIKHGNPSVVKPIGGCGEEFSSSITPIQTCESISGKKMDFSEAEKIAKETCKNGEIKSSFFCNEITGTWWFDFIPNEFKNGCNPACVVDVEKGTAEINWRCTGLIKR